MRNEFECQPCEATWASEAPVGTCGGCGRDYVATTTKRKPVALQLLEEHAAETRRLLTFHKAETVDA